MTESEKINFALICIGLFILLLPIYNTRSLIRSRKLRKIAHKHNLSFSKGTILFNPFEVYRRKKNIISGSVKGHNLEIHDLQQLVPGHAIHRESVITLDSNALPNPYPAFFKKWTPVDKIEEYLSSLA